MKDRPSSPDPLPFDPVVELLKGGQPAVLAQQAGISVEELYQRRDAFLRMQAQKALEEDVIFRKVGRNEPCPCGSGQKYKKCCLPRHQEQISRMDPDFVRKRADREREKAQMEDRVREGYALLTQRKYQEARSLATRFRERYSADDRFHDIIATAALYLDDLEAAIETCESRWKAALAEKAFFLAQRRHSYDDVDAPLGHAFAPQAWLERYWVALMARNYRDAYPTEPVPEIQALIFELRKADDLDRFTEQREEGLRARQKALADPIQALKEKGARALPYLLPLCTRYGWSGLLVPDILLHWGDDASVRALVDIALFYYPYLSESCLQALEKLGERALPHLMEAFERDQDFDPLKIGLISVAGRMGTEKASQWIVSLLDHADPAIVTWAGRVLSKIGFVGALEKIEEANRRIGPEPGLQRAIEELGQLRTETCASSSERRTS